MQIDRGELCQEGRNDRRDCLQHAWRTAELDRAARFVTEARRRGARGLHFVHHLAAVVVKLIPDFGHPEAPGRSLDQADSELGFKIRDFSAELRLWLADRSTGGSKAAVRNHLSEIVEIVEVLHLPSLC